eukprot:1728328-Amphidinium_carterae.2
MMSLIAYLQSGIVEILWLHVETHVMTNSDMDVNVMMQAGQLGEDAKVGCCQHMTQLCTHLAAGQPGEDARVGLLPARDTVCGVVQLPR